MNVNDAPINSADSVGLIYQHILLRVRKGYLHDNIDSDPLNFDEFLSANWTKLTVEMQRILVSNSIELFLRLNRNERSRNTVEAVITAVDDINQCPDIGHQTLLEYACGGSGKVDLGIAKALLKAGHSLDRAAENGISPWQALGNLYTSKKRYYDKCRTLFITVEHKAKCDLRSVKRMKRPISIA